MRTRAKKNYSKLCRPYVVRYEVQGDTRRVTNGQRSFSSEEEARKWANSIDKKGYTVTYVGES